MIYAEDITKYNCTTAELEERIMFWVAVAGKNANTQAHKLDEFLALMRDGVRRPYSPFELIRRTLDVDKTLVLHMKAVGLGKYSLMERAYTMLARSKWDLRTVSVETLETVPGIGPKTARCFVLHSREGARVAGLDRHVMRYLAAKGHCPDGQLAPGSPKEYARLEQAFLTECDTYGMTPADFDLMLWKIGAKRPL